MPQTVELPDELATALSDEATKLGMSLPDYAVRILSASSRQTQGVQTGADLVEYWKSHGVIGSRPEITDSQAHARLLRDQAERRGPAS